MAVLTRAAAPLLLLALALGGCSRDPLLVVLADDQLMVHAVLEAGSDTAIVQLTEIRATDRGAGLLVRGVEGARVELSGAGLAVRLAETARGSDRCGPQARDPWGPEGPPEPTGCYLAALPERIRPGARYALRVVTADGRLVTGAAQVPAVPVLLRLEDGARMPAVPSSRAALETDRSVRLAWRVDDPAAMVNVSTRTDASFRGLTGVPNLACDAVLEARFRNEWGDESFDPQRTDSLRQRVVVRGCAFPGGTMSREIRPDSVHLRIRVAVFDTAFARYRELIRSGTSVRASQASVGLQGAVGVFAATAAAERRIVVLRRREPDPPAPESP